MQWLTRQLVIVFSWLFYKACPPDTLITWPVSILACSLAKNNMVSAISSGWISLLIGINGITAFSNSSSIQPVCVGPGATQFTVMPYFATSRAMLRVANPYIPQQLDCKSSRTGGFFNVHGSKSTKKLQHTFFHSLVNLWNLFFLARHPVTMDGAIKRNG